jgi:hypothetical protein
MCLPSLSTVAGNGTTPEIANQFLFAITLIHKSINQSGQYFPVYDAKTIVAFFVGYNTYVTRRKVLS